MTEGEEHTITLDQESAGMLKLPNLCSLEIYKANINFLLGIWEKLKKYMEKIELKDVCHCAKFFDIHAYERTSEVHEKMYYIFKMILIFFLHQNQLLVFSMNLKKIPHMHW